MKFISSILIVSLFGSTNAFQNNRPRAGQTTESPLFFASFVEKEREVPTATKKIEPKAKKAPKKKVGGHGQDGLFAPAVVAAKNVLGENELNKIRAKAISLHSKVITNFVDTSDTEFGNRVLEALFSLADQDSNGTIDEEELATALRSVGFRHLKEKQIKGIFERADKDSNGALDLDEWKKSAPATLRTNLIKLAKTNGGELGFLA